MIHVGASLNASISSGAGFGTLVMAVVMLMQTVSPLVASASHVTPHMKLPPSHKQATFTQEQV